MSILITGGAGFIGSHLSDALLKKGYKVIVVDNLSLGTIKNIEHNLSVKGFYFHKCDITEINALNNIFEKHNIHTVFHMAANSDIAKSYVNPDVDMQNTFFTTYNVLQTMRRYDVKNIVFASTSAIYGETRDIIDESFGPLFPVSHYGAAKLASEAFISSFVENYRFKAWIVRFPNVVGERATHGVIFDFINKLKTNQKKLEILGDGNQNKPYLYVKDLVEAMIFIWENSDEKLNYFNVGLDSRTTVKKIAQIVCEEMDINPEFIFTGGDRGWIGDVPEFFYSLEKVHKLGWRAKMDSDSAVRCAVRAILGKGI